MHWHSALLTRSGLRAPGIDHRRAAVTIEKREDQCGLNIVEAYRQCLAKESIDTSSPRLRLRSRR